MRWVSLKYALQELKFLQTRQDWKILFHHKAPIFFYKLVLKKLLTARVPYELQLEPTNTCGLRCICCSVARTTRKKGFLDFNLFEKIIVEAAEIGVRKVHFYLHGEPLLHPKIAEMIGLMKSHQLGICLATNGMLLSQEKARALLQAGLNSADSILFSILGSSKKVHELVMPGVNHEQVLDNVHGLLTLRRQLKGNGPIIETVFYSMPENIHEQQSFRQQWHRIVDRVRVVDKISTSFADYKLNQTAIQIRIRPCDLVFERLTVFWNGDVTLCAQDVDGRYNFGNLQENSLAEVWNCAALAQIRSRQRKKKFNELSQCQYCDW